MIKVEVERKCDKLTAILLRWHTLPEVSNSVGLHGMTRSQPHLVFPSPRYSIHALLFYPETEAANLTNCENLSVQSCRCGIDWRVLVVDILIVVASGLIYVVKEG